VHRRRITQKVRGRPVQYSITRSVLAKQRFHLPLQFVILSAGFRQERGAVFPFVLKRSVVEPLDLTPALGFHSMLSE
jgi:hypothetical protein